MDALNELVGKTLAEVIREGDDALVFKTADGETYKMFHRQDCCENVTINDIAGNLADLIGSPITKAETVSSDKDPDGFEPPEDRDGSFTWTFYHLATVEGYVTIRWYGESNGCYSESVDFEKCSEN